MKKFLVIVESPTKAKTINKYLGNNYIVKSSFGHIRDLSNNGVFYNKNNKVKKRGVVFDKKEVLINRIGIDPYHGWLAKYKILPGKEEIVDEINVLAKSSDRVYLATDFDREGEAIAWHLKEVLVKDKKISRVIFNEITCNAITKAFQHPVELDINKVHAQQARRFMDRLVGYMLSPLLWKKIARGLSAGRVQSVVVRLIVERERKIKNFFPKEYWELHASLIHPSGQEFLFRVVREDIDRFVPKTKEEVQKANDVLSKFDSYIINSRVDKSVITAAPPPFTTSTLQQAASLKFGYTIKRTMILAQQLYESGYITYMRTNSTHISEDALTSVRSYICEFYGQGYLPEKYNEYISKSFVQEAHEAIRPSNVYLLEELIEHMDFDLRKLYRLIWCRFVASQMKAARYVFITFLITVEKFQLRARDRMCCFDGWKKVMSEFSDRCAIRDHVISELKIGEILKLKKLSFIQHFTKPLARYTEASLVKELEKRGIGRPSTYVPIISTIQDRGYVYLRHSSFHATKIGEIVTDRLFENFRELMDYQFTANMEDILDRISDNREEWKSVLDDFFIKLVEKLNKAEKDFQDGGMRPNPVIMTNIICSLCGKNMEIRTAVTGVFLSCEGYKMVSLKNRCKNTINLIFDTEDDVESKRDSHFVRCEKCNSIMDSYFIDNCRKIRVCSNSPLCDGYVVEDGMFFMKESNNFNMQCEKCMHDMCLRFGRFGKYMSCNNVNCKHTRRILSNSSGCTVLKKPLCVPFPELLCKKSNSYFVLRSGKLGVFFSAHTFPHSKETRAPLVEELVRFRDRLPENLFYLADAPIYDDCGNKTLVRFDRKDKQQYIVSEKDGKLTGWKSFFVDGHWKIMKNK